MEKQRKEHKGLKVLRFIGLVFLVMIAAGVALYLYADNKADIVKGYNREIDTGGPLEAKYLQDGPYAAKKTTARAMWRQASTTRCGQMTTVKACCRSPMKSKLPSLL